MSIIQLLRLYSNIEIEELLKFVLKKPKEFLLMEPEYKLTTKQYNNLTKFAERRAKGEPLAYVLGYKDFYGLKFKVNKDVLIPRPETEWIVERVKNLDLRFKNDKTSVLDVGTGSGCIPISIAEEFQKTKSKFQVTASDISEAALKVAKENAKIHKAKIKFIHSDLFKNIDGKFDVITANLPYVPKKMLSKFMLNKQEFKKDDPFIGLRYEPPFALTDGSSIWLIYKKFFEQVRSHLNPGAVILLETDPSSRKFLKEYQEKYLPKAKIKFHKDFNNLWRFMEINCP